MNEIKANQRVLDDAIYEMQKSQHEVDVARKNLDKAKDDLIFDLSNDLIKMDKN